MSRKKGAGSAWRDLPWRFNPAATKAALRRLEMELGPVPPAEETATIVPFLDDDDMFIQERACELLGERRFAPAAGALRRIAREGMPNGRQAAKRALVRLRDGA